MSENENWTGTLIEIKLGEVSIEEHLQRYYNNMTIDYETYLEYSEGEDGKFVEVDGRLFQYTSLDCSNSNWACRDSAGIISFSAEFYNGGACLSEMVKNAIRELLRREAKE